MMLAMAHIPSKMVDQRIYLKIVIDICAPQWRYLTELFENIVNLYIYIYQSILTECKKQFT